VIKVSDGRRIVDAEPAVVVDDPPGVVVADQPRDGLGERNGPAPELWAAFISAWVISRR
jgi:hypothetical protein